MTATVNGWLQRSFIVDSGAADVQVSADVFRALYPRGTAAPPLLPGTSYRLADGSLVRSRRFVLASVRIGDREFQDVDASIGSAGAPLLLGQTVLARLGAWSIDNRRGVLVLAEPAGRSSGMECVSWQTAPPTCAVAALREFFRRVRPRHDVTSLRLLENDGDRATVLVDVVRPAGRRPRARLCGPMGVRLESSGWRVAGEAALREIAIDARCVP